MVRSQSTRIKRIKGTEELAGEGGFHSKESSNGAKAVLKFCASSVSSSSDWAQAFQSNLSFIPRSEVRTILQERGQLPVSGEKRVAKKETIPSELETERPPGCIEQPHHNSPIGQIHPEITLLPIRTGRQCALSIRLRFQPHPLPFADKSFFDFICKGLRHGYNLDVSMSTLGADPCYFEGDHCSSVLLVEAVKCYFISIGDVSRLACKKPWRPTY